MKKLIAGTFVVIAIAAVVLDIQYAWKPDTLGQEAKTVQQINS
ncbi:MULTISPECIES: NprX family peptide pheromone [unclassified Bacillus cereus group]|nr:MULTISPECIES: NprX family peptide pheromone [unclassified Bacillus cereus group]MDX5879792.1 NprX family peptide pheromone [Bacillus cereus group sp. BfR-BA-01042]MDX5905815.1 NprX family peptide pheromone [Bacillus cereus group sp. BfR-BA-01048]